ncbi:MAG: hypothetical protein HZB44_08825 [Actinobacteria bacterium]|nr:hypothetical protein [Actinomycetota bacterium]
MKRVVLSLLWYLAVVVLVDIPPILLFFLMHRFNLLGSLAPQIMATFLFLGLMAGQAYLHLHLLNRRFPQDGDKNAWTMITVSLAAFATFWIIVIALIAWATNRSTGF